jgi:hypothetical protein
MPGCPWLALQPLSPCYTLPWRRRHAAEPSRPKPHKAGPAMNRPTKPKLSAAPRDALSALPKEMMAHVASFAGWRGLLQGLEVTGKCGRELAAPGYAYGIEKLRGRVGAVDARRACLAVAATRWNHALQPVFGDGALRRASRLWPSINSPRGARDFEARLGFAANSARTRPDDAEGTVLVCDVLRQPFFDGGDALVTNRSASLIGSWVVDGDRCTLAHGSTVTQDEPGSLCAFTVSFGSESAVQASTRELWEGANDLTLRLWAVTQDGAVACVLVDCVELDRSEGALRCVTAESQNLVSWPNPWQVGRPQCEMRPRATFDGDRFSLRAATFCFVCADDIDESYEGEFLDSLVEEGVWVPTRPRTL